MQTPWGLVKGHRDKFDDMAKGDLSDLTEKQLVVLNRLGKLPESYFEPQDEETKDEYWVRQAMEADALEARKKHKLKIRKLEAKAYMFRYVDSLQKKLELLGPGDNKAAQKAIDETIHWLEAFKMEKVDVEEFYDKRVDLQGIDDALNEALAVKKKEQPGV